MSINQLLPFASAILLLFGNLALCYKRFTMLQYMIVTTVNSIIFTVFVYYSFPEKVWLPLLSLIIGLVVVLGLIALFGGKLSRSYYANMYNTIALFPWWFVQPVIILIYFSLLAFITVCASGVKKAIVKKKYGVSQKNHYWVKSELGEEKYKEYLHEINIHNPYFSLIPNLVLPLLIYFV